MTERQKVEWMYYALDDLIVNAHDYSRDRMSDRIAMLSKGVKRILKEREDKPGLFIAPIYKERHDKVVQHLKSCISQMTEAWGWTNRLRNIDSCQCIRTAMNLLGELITEQLLYTELLDEE